jgi:hypothetical protein
MRRDSGGDLVRENVDSFKGSRDREQMDEKELRETVLSKLPIKSLLKSKIKKAA